MEINRIISIDAKIAVLIKTFQKMDHSIKESQLEIQNAFKSIAESMLKIPKSVLKLSEIGWYINYDIMPGEINKLSDKIEGGEIDYVNSYLIDYFDRESEAIQCLLTDRFPKRVNVINACFRAHKNGDYYLSVPCFLAQIEGICKEITSIRFFSISRSIPKTSNWVKDFDLETFSGGLLKPMKQLNDFRNIQDLNNPNQLNRHDILHGDCCDYGEDSLTSFKCLSLLYYLGDIVYNLNKLRIV